MGAQCCLSIPKAWIWVGTLYRTRSHTHTSIFQVHLVRHIWDEHWKHLPAAHLHTGKMMEKIEKQGPEQVALFSDGTVRQCSTLVLCQLKLTWFVRSLLRLMQ